MKKRLLKTMLLLCALIVGSGTMWAEDVTYTFTSVSNATTWVSSSGNWTASTASDGFDNTKGVTIYKAHNGITITSPTSYDNISKIEVTWSTSSNGVGNIQAKIGSGDFETIGTVSKSKTNNTFTKEYSTTLSGTVVIKVNCTKSTIFIGSVKIYYTSGGGDTPTTFTVTYAANGGSGTMTDNNPYEEGAEVTLLSNTFTPPSGKQWSSWDVTDASSNTVSVSNGKFTMPASNVTVTAQWADLPSYTITAQSNNNSYGTVELSGNVITASPANGYTYADPAYTVSSGTATVVQNGDEFTVTPTSNCTVTINFAPIPTYTVTIETPSNGTLVVKNGDDEISSGDAFPVGTELTIITTPAENYYTQNWQYKKGEGSWVTKTSGTTYTMDANNVSIRANFMAKHYVYWSVNGTVTQTDRYAKGETITFPDDPDDVEEKTFVGWVEETITGTTDDAPTFVTAPQSMATANRTFYAVFADKEAGNAVPVIDELTRSTTGVSGTSYTDWSNKSVTNGSGAVYAGNSAGDNSAIQIRTKNNNSGIVTTSSNNIASKVKVTWNSNTADKRTLNIYGKTSAYTDASDLYDNDKQGTLLGSLYHKVSINDVETTTTELTITGNYQYIGLRSNSDAMYLDEVDITWLVGTPDTYSGYCTTVAPDTRTAVNMTGFSATSTTLVVGNTTNTTVTNDQNGWTAAYTYESDNTEVATVDEYGEITAVAKGTATITAYLNVDKDDENYKKGETRSMTVDITVTKPFHTATFYVNGANVRETSVEEGEAIEFPSDPSVPTYNFVGWATAEITNSQNEAPTTVTSADMGNANINYYAVFATEGVSTYQATFDPTDITDTPLTSTRTWTDSNTGIYIYISSGQRYTDGTPNTFTVNNSGYLEIEVGDDKAIREVNLTVSGNDYKANSVRLYESASASTGTLIADTDDSELTEDGLTSTVTSIGDWPSLCFRASSSNQIRATLITVTAEKTTLSDYRTTLPSQTITLNAACTDGDMVYGTYSSSQPFVVSDDIIVSEIAIVDDKLYVEPYETGDVVPANTGVMVSALEGGNYNVTIATTEGSSVLEEENRLRPTGETGITAAAMGTADANCLYYRLTMHNGTTIGYWWGAEDGAAFNMGANKAYLAIPEAQAARMMGFGFDDINTAISSINNTIDTNAPIYNVLGQRVAPTTKGILIQNGKKLINK